MSIRKGGEPGDEATDSTCERFTHNICKPSAAFSYSLRVPQDVEKWRLCRGQTSEKRLNSLTVILTQPSDEVVQCSLCVDSRLLHPLPRRRCGVLFGSEGVNVGSPRLLASQFRSGTGHLFRPSHPEYDGEKE